MAGGEQLAHVAPIHADEGDGAVTAGACGVAERLAQECGEGLPRSYSIVIATVTNWRIRCAASESISVRLIGQGIFVTRARGRIIAILDSTGRRRDERSQYLNALHAALIAQNDCIPRQGVPASFALCRLLSAGTPQRFYGQAQSTGHAVGI